MKMRWFGLTAALAAAGAAQTGSVVGREGRYWTGTLTGTVALRSAKSIRVVSNGSIRVDGGARGDIAYVLTAHTRAQSEDAARIIFKRVGVKAHQQQNTMVLEVLVPQQAQTAADITLKVPRSLRATALESLGETIQVFDLEGSLQAVSAGGELQVDRVQGDVVVRTGGGQVRLGRIGRKVDCYSGAGRIYADSIGGAAELNTEGGDIFVKEAMGTVSASTGGGNIHIERAQYGVTAGTRGGLIEVVHANGPVTALTGTGSIRVRSAANVQCQSGLGAIQLRSVFGGLRASTASGSIVADLSAVQPLRDSELSTAMGDITVYIPSNLAVTVQAVNNTPGRFRIVSDFSEIQPRLDPQAARIEAQGSLNGGGPILRLTGAGGMIYLRRQK
jgi:DUF4097 and DUF4098 domain-containing protein YvlB